MRMTFLGVRGSIPVPGPDTARYGGNTACIAIEDEQSPLIILDAGSGIRPLGLQLAAKAPFSCAIFLSHTHWDHIQGLPFFTPLFLPGVTVDIYGPFDPVRMQGIENVLDVQMQYAYFPVRSAELRADIRCHALREGQSVDIGRVRVTPALMNHTVTSFGYRAQSGDKGLFYTGDHEDYRNIYAPGEEHYAEYEAMIAQRRERLVRFAQGADVLVADAQYAAEEYPSRIGWGHSCPEQAVMLAVRAGIKSVYFTHHEPVRDDAALDRFFGDILRSHGDKGLSLAMASEGACVSI